MISYPLRPPHPWCCWTSWARAPTLRKDRALAKAILGHLAARGVTTIATTHHRGVAAHAEATTGMMNASVELDPASLRPTYHLTLGVPGRSYAMSVAAEMGVPDEIMEEASSLLEPQHLRFEDWLNELQSQRLQLQDRLREADETQARAEAAQRDLDAQLDELESHREDILRSTRGDLATQYEEVRSKLRRAEAELSWRPSADEVEEARVEITSAKRELQALDRRVPRKQHRLQEGPLAIGDLVDIQGLNVQGRIESISKQDSEAEVAVGDVRFRLDIHRLARAQEEQEEKEREPDDPKVSYRLASAVPTMELNLHGSRPEDAMIKVDEFLDKALIDGLSTVHIIHGRGTGALRRAIRDLLACHPLAKSFAPAAPENGGDGATVVELT